MNQDIAPCLDEIAAVLRKHNMAGISIVANQTHCDYTMEVSPSWSCATLIPAGDGEGMELRIKSKLADYPSKEMQEAALQATVGTFVTFNDAMTRVMEQNEKVLVMIAKHVQFTGRSTLEG